MQTVTHHGRPGRLTGLATRLAAGWRMWHRRRAYKRLMDLDDRMLRDIGLTRLEVLHGAGLPLSANAAEEVQRLSRSRRHAAFAAGRPWL